MKSQSPGCDRKGKDQSCRRCTERGKLRLLGTLLRFPFLGREAGGCLIWDGRSHQGAQGDLGTGLLQYNCSQIWGWAMKRCLFLQLSSQVHAWEARSCALFVQGSLFPSNPHLKSYSGLRVSAAFLSSPQLPAIKTFGCRREAACALLGIFHVSHSLLARARAGRSTFHSQSLKTEIARISASY